MVLNISLLLVYIPNRVNRFISKCVFHLNLPMISMHFFSIVLHKAFESYVKNFILRTILHLALAADRVKKIRFACLIQPKYEIISFKSLIFQKKKKTIPYV